MLKKYKIKVNGNEYEVEVEEIKQVAQPSITCQIDNQSNLQNTKPQVKKSEPKKSNDVPSGAATICAPMPGTVLRIDVKEGDIVKAGQVLLILEAMKMENEITAPQDGKIASVNVDKGTAVSSGDVMISIC